MLEDIGFSENEYIHTPNIFIPKINTNKIKGFIKNFKKKTIILLNTHGGAGRIFNDQFSIELSKKLTSLNKSYHIILSSFSKYIKNYFLNNPNPSITKTFDTTIYDLFSLIKISDFIITPDTSIVHISGIMQKPLFAFYGTNLSNFIANGPWWKKENIIYHNDLSKLTNKDLPKIIKKIQEPLSLVIRNIRQ